MRPALLALLVLPAALLLSSGAYAQKELPRHKQPKQSKADKDVWNVTFNDGLPLEYIQPRETVARLEKEGQLKMWDATKLAEEKRGIPAGGVLLVMLNRNTLDKANPKNLTIIVQDPQGVELVRFEPPAKVPRLHYAGAYPIYSTVVGVPVTMELPAESKVFVVDGYEQLRFEYIIRPLAE